jgi:aspartate aminotransferase-like enzyme
MEQVRAQLKLLFGTQSEVAILTASGTGGMEAAVTSLLRKSDRVLVVDAGKFGSRFAKMTQAFGLSTDVITVEWGQAVQIEQIKKAMSGGHSALCIQMSETSTGTLHPIKEIGTWLKQNFPRCLLIVDGITAVGAMAVPMDEWEIDALISGSQKALMLPPGLAFVAPSAKAKEAMKVADLPQFYFSLKRELEQIEENQTAFTPAISLVVALKEALDMLMSEGLEKVYERHATLAAATRKALSQLGLKPASASPSVACSAFFLPASIDGKAFLKSIRERYGFLIAGGQDAWEGKAIRLSHLGYYTAFDLMNAITAIGLELQRSKISVDLPKALQEFIATAKL